MEGQFHDLEACLETAIPCGMRSPVSSRAACPSSTPTRSASLGEKSRNTRGVGLSLDAIIPRGFFVRTGAEMLIFGAGGFADATVLSLAGRVDPGDRPGRVLVVNRSRPRLESLRAIIERRPRAFEVEYVENADPAWLAKSAEAAVDGKPNSEMSS